ncbi:MAG TPA: hypothetical protein VEP90_29460 [Methylomirabilota bacterium]|nr:hypothetical protein [Methylomirabilota bacterium]
MKKKAYVSVNKHVILRNARNGTSEPAISWRIGKSGKSHYVKELVINGPCKLMYDPHKPILKCGARLVIETESEYIK